MKNRRLSDEPVFTVLDPRAEEPEREIKPLNARLDTLTGKKVNVINLHGGNEEVIESIVSDLKAAVTACDIEYYRTDGGFGGLPLSEKDWDRMLACDAAILGHNF